MLGKRVLTAAVLVPLLVAVTLIGDGVPFLLLAGAAAALCAAEYFRMFFPARRDRVAGVASAVLAYASGALLAGPEVVAALSVCVGLAAFHFLPGDAPPDRKAKDAGLAVLGVVYIGAFLAAWPRTIRVPGGPHWVLFGLLAVAAGDSAAYFAGRAFGKRKLAPAVSPNKTVEGAVGGLAASVVLATAYAAFLLPSVPAWYAVLSSAAAGAAGQAGDLFESLLKRAAGVKDSGSILPGHGGLFDRADGVIGAGPVVCLLALAAPLAGGAA